MFVWERQTIGYQHPAVHCSQTQSQTNQTQKTSAFCYISTKSIVVLENYAQYIVLCGETLKAENIYSILHTNHFQHKYYLNSRSSVLT